jgi:parallel beta-helix repeat protein
MNTSPKDRSPTHPGYEKLRHSTLVAAIVMPVARALSAGAATSHRLAMSASMVFMLAQTLWVPPALAATIIVPSSGIATIQDGIDAASNWDTIIVKDGYYPGDINFKGKSVIVQSEHGPQSCTILGAGFYRGITVTKGETATVDGFTISDCVSPEGGAIHVESKSAVTIRHCIITDNHTDWYGAGIYVYNAFVEVDSCAISNNVANHDGGGIYIAHNSYSRSMIHNSVIAGNQANESGGGIYVNHADPFIAACTISQNSTLYSGGGGGGIYAWASDALIEYCLINGNSSATFGGGIVSANSTAATEHCTISGNRAAYAGGGLHLDSSDCLVSNCVVSGNVNYNGGGGIEIRTCTPAIANCVISGNATTSESGAGGVNCYEAFPIIRNCTLSGNVGLGGHGGGLGSADSVPTIVNTILWGDSAPEIYVHNSAFWPNREPVVSYSDIAGGGYQGTGNISSDPQFTNAAGGDFHLQTSSPCLDSGSNVGAPPADLDGITRPQDGNDDGLAIADLGAYEVAGPPALSSRFFLNPSDPEYIPDSAFRNSSNRTALASKIEAVLLMIDRGEYAQALNKLQNDVLKKTDGCARSGAPDKDDWIATCEYQQIVYSRVTRTIQALEFLVMQEPAARSTTPYPPCAANTRAASSPPAPSRPKP